MLFRGILLAALAVAVIAISSTTEAGSKNRVVSPLVVPPIPHDPLYPIRMPLAGAFLVSQPPYCGHKKSGRCRTMYYFQGRFADRPDIFYIVKKKH